MKLQKPNHWAVKYTLENNLTLTNMKIKYFLITFLGLLGNLVSAHTINYDKVILKHWLVEKENKFVEGSFYMYKNGNVFIEDANDNIINYPLAYFSKADQTFALKKAEWVKELNYNRLVPETGKVEKKSAFDIKFLVVVLILFGIGFYFFRVRDKTKSKYLIPILAVGVGMTLFSFTANVIKSLQSITDPLFVDSAFTPFKPNVYTHWDANYFYVESIGIPTTHSMMTGITSWQQQVPIPQCYIGNNPWSIPLNPVLAATPIPVSPSHFTRGAIAVAINGIAIFNPYTNTGADAFLTGQLDNWGGHCGRADDYHYHIAPMSLYNFTSPTSPIAFALDGFAVYGNLEPDGAAMAPLDSNNGHFGTNGVYHYHGVAAAPYMIGKMVGLVTEDSTFQIIPQPHANPIRPSGTPLNGAVITNCKPNTANNGYTLSYTLSGNTDSIVYNWNTSGLYTFKFYTIAGSTTSTYNGFSPCLVPTSLNEIASIDNDVMIYPNPTHENFSLQLSNAVLEKDIQQISIYNLKGELIFKTEHFQQSTATRNLSKGTYIVKIQFAKSQLTKKLVVQ